MKHVMDPAPFRRQVQFRVSKRPRVQFGEPLSKELEPDLQFLPAFNADVRHTLFDSLAPVHALRAAKHTQGLTFLLKGVYGGHRCTIMLDRSIYVLCRQAG